MSHPIKNKGFTILELLVVIAVLGILAAIAFAILKPAFLFGQARDAQRRSDLKQIQVALEQYRQDHGSYPAGEWRNSTAGGTWLSELNSTYIKTLPLDPLNTGCTGTTVNPRDGSAAGATCYTYAYYSGGWVCSGSTTAMNGNSYILAARFESYGKSDLSSSTFIKSDGQSCTWSEAAVTNLYVLTNP